MGHLLVGNLHLFAPSPGSSSIGAEGSPQKIFLQYPCPDCEKGREVWLLLYRDSVASFYRQCLYYLTLLGNQKFLWGQTLKIFQKGKKDSTAKRSIFRRFISTNTFDNLVKSYMFPSETYYFLYFRKSMLTAWYFQPSAKRALWKLRQHLSPTQIWLSEIYFCKLTATNSKSWNWTVKK